MIHDKLIYFSNKMYSSPHAVGPIALLEPYVIEYVDDYVENQLDEDEIDSEDETLEKDIYETIINQLNIEYIKRVIHWRLEELIEKRDKIKWKRLMKYKSVDYKSDHRLFDKLELQKKTKIEDIHSYDGKECDLLVFLLDGMNISCYQHSNIEIERINEFDVKIFINKMIYNLQEYEQNPYKYMLSID